MNRGDFSPILGCGMMIYYQGQPNQVNDHVRTVTLDIDWDLEDCGSPCNSVTNDGPATESLSYGFSSEPTLISIVAEDCT